MNPTWSVRDGDALERLREMPDASVQCVVTSPPYWGLRDYGTATWAGGEAGCDHVQRDARDDASRVRRADAGSGRRVNAESYDNGSAHPFRFPVTCGKCGARRIDAQLGLEPTPDAYVAKMVEVFREVKRVLRDDGTLWLNLGDSYASQGGAADGVRDGGILASVGREDEAGTRRRNRSGGTCGLKTKDLVGIPWRVAFALQADGWYLRSDIIWAKPNPMPESVTDRPTKSHEYVFLMTKSARYFFDAEAVREASITNDPRRPYTSAGAWALDGRAEDKRHGGEDRAPDATSRNIRSVWTIATQPFPEAHFATYPEELVERCIKAGSGQDSLVLDPFAGSGTTGAVAIALGRSFVGVELNPAYVQMARKRIGNVAPLLAAEILEVAP